jgi:hypothetical protein
MLFKIICIFSLFLIVSSEFNVTCNDGRICFTYQSVDDHCEILFGPECFPPCEIKQCSIRVENDVLCDHYVCTPIPPKPASSNPVLNFFLGAIGSMITSGLSLLLWRYYKKLKARRFRVLQNEPENEGDSESRPIIRRGSSTSLNFPPSAPPASPPRSSSQPELSQSLPSTSCLENQNFEHVKKGYFNLRNSLKIKVKIIRKNSSYFHCFK